MTKIPGLREGPHIPLPCSWCNKQRSCWTAPGKPLGEVKGAFEGCEHFERSDHGSPPWFPYPIRYVGDCGISGYGYAMRGVLAALRGIGVTEEQIDIMPWRPAMSLQQDWLYERFLYARERPSFAKGQRVNIIGTPLQEVAHFWTAGWHNVVVADCKTNGPLPEGVAAAINRCDEVWAATEHTRWTLLQAGVEVPVHVVPYALQPELLETPPKVVAPDIAPEVHPYIGPHEFKHTSPVCFYYIGRQNIDGLLQAYFNTGWTDTDPVELIIHNPRSVVKLPERDGAPIVRLLAVPKTYHWICKLHQMNHVFVTATRGSGFCLPAWEAAAVGNLVVVPQDALETPPGAVTYGSKLIAGSYDWEPDLEDLTLRFKVAFDLIRSGWLGTDWAIAARKQVSPGVVGELLKERLTAIKAELRDD
jgi:hypothetical protein